MVSKEVIQLRNEYKLMDLDITRLETELELTRLKIDFVIVKCKQENMPFYDALIKYAGLKRFTQQLSPKEFGELEKQLWGISVDDLNEDSVSELASELFYKSDYTKDICNHVKRGACFKYDIWENEGASLHFGNAVIPKNPFKGEELENRKEELRTIAKDIRENHPKIKYIFSVSWMWNYEVFQDLMPKEFNEHLKEYKENNFYSLGHWGQFYRHDGTLNKERVQEFRKTWKFPLKILLGQCDIKYFLEMYG